MKKNKNEKTAEKKGRVVLNRKVNVVTVLLSVLMLFCFGLFFAARWYFLTYGDIGFESIMFTMLSGLNGVQSGLISDYIVKGLIPTVLCWAVCSFFIFFESDKKIVLKLFKKIKLRIYPFNRIVQCILVVVLSVALAVGGAHSVSLFEYIEYQRNPSKIYEEKYIDPMSVQVFFPEEKRNLIYIFVESLETTFLSTEHGGASDKELMPELYNMALQNVNFSTNDKVGGAYAVNGTTWTAGALVSHTAGIPLKTPFGMADNTYGADSFLPGANSIMDILKANGYYQTLMFGSDATFANRDVYYKTHGVDKVYDYFTAKSDGIIAEDYYAWWGMEDKYLFEYAKKELPKLAAMDQPFAFNMLTVDTHHIGGYICEYCKNDYSEQYENVISCQSRQVYEFVEWIKTQDFYENTTIVVTGDHPTMDSGYITRNIKIPYDRTVYDCFINSAVTTENIKNRAFTPMDMMPTTLAALGCSIDGERLGLGTNLFSTTPTLAEEMGIHEFRIEMSKASDYYTKQFIYGIR